MMFDLPKKVGYFVVIGLLLLAVAGASDSIGNALQDNYHQECDPYGSDLRFPGEPGKNETNNETDNETYEPPTAQERAQCRDARLPVTVMKAIMNATLAPGIALVAISAAFIVSAAIAARQR